MNPAKLIEWAIEYLTRYHEDNDGAVSSALDACQQAQLAYRRHPMSEDPEGGEGVEVLIDDRDGCMENECYYRQPAVGLACDPVHGRWFEFDGTEHNSWEHVKLSFPGAHGWCYLPSREPRV